MIFIVGTQFYGFKLKAEMIAINIILHDRLFLFYFRKRFQATIT